MNPPHRLIMVVDDDAAIRNMLAFALSTEGWEVVTIADGREALDRLRQGLRPCAVLLDLTMPRMNGSEFLAELRRDPAIAKTPVVVLSGDGHVHQKATALGIAGFLLKPVDLPILHDLLETYCRETS